MRFGNILAVTGVVIAVGCAVPGAVVDESLDSGGSGASSNGGSEAGGKGNQSGASNNAGNGGGVTEHCSVGETQPCWESPDGVPFAGEAPTGQATCHAGERKCQGDTTWGACLGAVGPEMNDTCDAGNDANCNGKPNEGCSCEDGDKRACGSDVGNCQQGEQTCKDKVWGDCVGEIVKQAKDGCAIDDDADCNGTPHEGCDCVNGEEQECGTDIGPCEFGKKVCVNGVWPDACEGGVPAATNDTCVPGNDANCNGTMNEKCACTNPEPVACGVIKGACKLGMQTCQSGTLSECSVKPTTNDTCFAADDANDTNCNGNYRDGCACVATDGPAVCPDSNGCGMKQCDGNTGMWGACVGDNKTHRCNPQAQDSRQICNANGVWTNDLCPAGSVCRGNGGCKLSDGQACTAASDCDSNACNSFYLDADKDGYAPNTTVVKFCGTTKTGYVAVAANKGTDCADGNANVNPGATEACDGVDNDCDSKTDLADGLAVSGSVVEVGPTGNVRGQPEIAWAAEKSAYGIVFEDDTAATNGIYFTTLTQAGAVQTAVTNVGDTSDGYGMHIIWGTDNFGLTWFDSGTGNIRFRTVASNGAVGLIREIINGELARPQVARYGTGTWAVSYLNYVEGFGYVGAKTVSAAGAIGAHVDITTSNSNYGNIVATSAGFATSVDLASKTAKASIYTSALASPASLTVGGYAPLLGVGPNGFAIAVVKGGGAAPQFYSFDDAGNAGCGPVNVGDAAFAPTDLVGTADGYLVVSSGGNLAQGIAVRAQLVKNDCSLGPLFTLDAAAGAAARVSGGSAGYGVVWESASNKVKRRFFGPRFCN